MTTRQVEQLLAAIARTSVSPSTVNRARSLISAVYSYGMRPSTFGLGANPAKHADRRSEPDPLHLAFYSPERVEALAQAMAAGAHRDRVRVALAPDEVAARAEDDSQDAQIVRIAAFAGLRRGELVVLRWRDVDLAARKLTVRRTVSGERELSSTKTRRAREVPIPDQAEAAFSRLLRRGDFNGPDDYVFVNRYGRRLDPSALRAAIRACTKRGRARASALSRSAPHVRVAARCRRHRPRQREGGDGTCQAQHYGALPSRPPSW